MFSVEHQIYKYASRADRLDDWLPYAEKLVETWSTLDGDEVNFTSIHEIVIASLLLKDDLLPSPARKAFAELMLKTLNEVEASKLRVDCLHISPPKPGRSSKRFEILRRCRDVHMLIREGKTASQAYEVVAEKHCKSTDTIRRDYERHLKKIRERKRIGENEG